MISIIELTSDSDNPLFFTLFALESFRPSYFSRA